jgi:hypothetical protein
MSRRSLPHRSANRWSGSYREVTIADERSDLRRRLPFLATLSSVLVLLVGFGALSGCCRTLCTDRTGCHWQCRVGPFPDDDKVPL